MTSPDDNLDDLLRGHFADALGPMRGQARRAFEREVVTPMRRRLRRRAWSALTGRVRQLAPLAATMAACAALGYVVPHWWAGGPARPTASATVAESVPPRAPAVASNVFGSPALAGYEQTHFEQHEDHGPGVLPDGTPGHHVRRTRVEAAHYTDPATQARTEVYFFAPEIDGVYSAARQ